ncbi:electron transfer flavoprotein subunit alpha/FixB family protein [Pseudomonas sp. UL073]|uniref:Electron transfer flavoprotein subunit alpha/FixB family protein n=1 Tax=Zestomonas insulae TaxID=2809017 RepID=A0ABS2I847_9GAMM|nr:electron transfer flavoprotein subunit alpha/FixB family protein [Pseudomonas insulae]MBM7059326.1 electron transfer flavoprotein subunit alpha/FixB family protein [Pseudomonas insulae]
MSALLAVIPQAWGDEALDATLAAAQGLADEHGGFSVLLLGAEVPVEARQRAAQAGARQVWKVTHAGLAGSDDPLLMAAAAAEALPALPAFAAGVPLVLLPPGPLGEELAARLAASLRGRALGRCLALRRDGTALVAERAAWGGRMRVSLRVTTGPAFACLRAGRPSLTAQGEPALHSLELRGTLPTALHLDIRDSAQRLPPLDGARLVVSGGRGVNEHGFALLEELAVALGGTLGGSLPAVDAGMVPVMRQVGVSGKFVSPQVYLAVGISGTPQHLAGISTDSQILAINKDASADIFKVASLGVVAAWEEVLPALLAELQQA